MTAPPSASSGECTPTKTRDRPTAKARSSANGRNRREHWPDATAAASAARAPHHDAEQPPLQPEEVQVRDDDRDDRDERIARRDDRGVEALVEREELIHQRRTRWRQRNRPTPATSTAATM